MTDRRAFLLSTAMLLAARGAQAETAFAPVTPRPLVFPRDHGAHPAFRIEWWYLTAVLDGTSSPLGLQVTFFRARTPIDESHPSRFAARQLLIAHAAIADPARGALQHDQRIARAGVGGVHAGTHDTDLALGRWRFAREASGAYRCAIDAPGFAFEFTATPSQVLLLQGEAGYSRKGRAGRDGVVPASAYYSQPQLVMQVRLTRDGRSTDLTGRGWLDHEWSSALLSADAAGWDWVGLNLDDGTAVTAFRIRPKSGGEVLYAYASLRTANGALRTFAPDEVHFAARAWWTSPRTNARYPVAMRIAFGDRVFDTEPLMPDQELDSRATAGAVYWEGASRVFENGRPVGRGYLEMTGYAAPMSLSELMPLPR
jgi:predicted secreted hydrolase